MFSELPTIVGIISLTVALTVSQCQEFPAPHDMACSSLDDLFGEENS